MKKILLAVLAAGLAAGFAAADESQYKIDFDGGSPSASLPSFASLRHFAQTPPPIARKQVKEWTVMVYMNGKNNLASAAIQNINEMEQVGSTKDFNVVAEVGHLSRLNASSTTAAGGDLWDGVRRYYVLKDNDPEVIHSQLVDAYNADMGDWQLLVDFAAWAEINYPAKKYMLIVWNHGAGWKGISYDDETENNLDTVQLRQALDHMEALGVYASDACLMQTAEVGDELKADAQFVVGSQEIEPGDGYNYTELLKGLAANPKASAEELAKMTVASYGMRYAGGTEKVTQSAVRSAELAGLEVRVNAWVDAVMASGDLSAVAQARDKAQSFDDAEARDFYDFVRIAVAQTKDVRARQAGRELMRFIADELVTAKTDVGHPGAHGVSVYVPLEQYNDSYDKLSWARDTRFPPGTKRDLKTARGPGRVDFRSGVGSSG